MHAGDPARRHGVDDQDALHAARFAVRCIDDDEGLTLLLGADRTRRFLEIGVLDLDGDDPVIIHAMRMRSKFKQYL